MFLTGAVTKIRVGGGESNKKAGRSDKTSQMTVNYFILSGRPEMFVKYT